MRRLARFFRRPTPANRRLSFPEWPAAVYAVGDVHGCYRQLVALERAIAADAASLPGEKWIVTLGDYVDRGPDSASVVEHLMTPSSSGLRRFCLMGNHEAMLLDYLVAPLQRQEWLAYGGQATLESYGEQDAADQPVIPQAHRDFLTRLPYTLSLPGIIFVHAGIRPQVPLPDQAPDDLLWIREPFLSADNLLPRVVHGHTPGTKPVVTSSRICVDTTAYRTGILTSVRVNGGTNIRFINSDGVIVDADWPHSLRPGPPRK